MRISNRNQEAFCSKNGFALPAATYLFDPHFVSVQRDYWRTASNRELLFSCFFSNLCANWKINAEASMQGQTGASLFISSLWLLSHTWVPLELWWHTHTEHIPRHKCFCGSYSYIHTIMIWPVLIHNYERNNTEHSKKIFYLKIIFHLNTHQMAAE